MVRKGVATSAFYFSGVALLLLAGQTHAPGVMGILLEKKKHASGSLGAQLGHSASGPAIGNPGPLGLSAFAVTTLLLSLVNAKVVGHIHPNIVLGMAFFYGGAVQIIAGIFEMLIGNTFGATAFASYGGFWMSWGYLVTPTTTALAAYSK